MAQHPASSPQDQSAPATGPEDGDMTLEQIDAARARQERVRLMIGVVEKGLQPLTPEEYAEQLARRQGSSSRYS